MCLTNVHIEAQLFLFKFVVRQGERERERWGALGARAEAYITSTTEDYRLGLQDIIDCRTAGHYRLQADIDVTPSCIDSIDGRRAASNN